jgi:hypothetical protein
MRLKFGLILDFFKIKTARKVSGSELLETLGK